MAVDPVHGVRSSPDRRAPRRFPGCPGGPPRIRAARCAATIAVVLLVASSHPSRSASLPSESARFGPALRFASDAVLAEPLRRERIEIPEGVTVLVAADVVIEARTELVIAGTLIASPEANSPSRDAPSLHLKAGDAIRISGRVQASHGLAGLRVGEAGGDGGSILLDAPLVTCEEDLVAGNGGDGGPSARGGDGGSVRLLRGRVLALGGTRVRSALGGSGGRGGAGVAWSRRGGDGGRGGHAIMAGEQGPSGSDEDGPRGQPGSPGLPCQNGGLGHIGFAAFGGRGGDGGNGAHGTTDGESGGAGGNGGGGGHARAGAGGEGGRGGDCSAACSKAGDGGAGGPATRAVAGWGGFGGHGGDGMGPGGAGGAGGNGGNGGTAASGDAGRGGDGGDCCTRADGVGGDGGEGGSAYLGDAYPGGGGNGGKGGNAGTSEGQGGKGGDGGHGLNGYGASGGRGGNGGEGMVAVGAGGAGNPAIGFAYLPLIVNAYPGVGGWPNGVGGDPGDSADVYNGFPGADGDPGKPCNTPSAPSEENQRHHDDGFETADAWGGSDVQPPTDGAFAERFAVQGSIRAIHLHLTRFGPTIPARADLYLWADDGGKPGAVLAVFSHRDPGPIAVWPGVSSHRFAIDYTVQPGADPVLWAGVWGDWPGQPPGFWLAADVNGPGGGDPHTRVAPGSIHPEGWQPVSAIFGPTQALGIGLEVVPLGACCQPTERGCCTTTTAEACAEAGGVFLGTGVSCEGSPCGATRAAQVTLGTGCFQLTVTQHGTIGFLDATQLEGVGLRVPPWESNHLRIGGLWVGVNPDSVWHRDYLGDPSPAWEVSSCPAGQIDLETELPRVRVAWSAMEAGPSPGGGATRFRQDQRTRVDDSPDGCGYAILEFTGQPPPAPGIETVHYGLFLDLDLGGTPHDDFGAVDLVRPLVYITDPSGIHVGLRLLRGAGEPAGDERLTLIPNGLFVDPNGYVTEADKWAFLTGADPDHVVPFSPVPGDYGILAAKPVTLAGSESPEWPTRPQFAVALVVASSISELAARSDQAQLAFEREVASAPEAAVPGAMLTSSPNPFREATTIRLRLDRPAEASIDVHDLAGRRVRELERGWLDRGLHAVTWDGRTERGVLVSPGVYFLRARVGDRTLTRPLLRVP